MLTELSKIYKKEGFRISLVSSTPSFIYGLSKSKNWAMTRKPSRVNSSAGKLKGRTSDQRLTATFEYKGGY